MKKTLSLVLAVLMTMTLFAGCGSQPAATTAPAAGEATQAAPEKAVKIGVAMATTQSTFYAKMADIIESYCKEINVDCTIADPNYDLAKQIEAVENFIASGCTAIVVVAFDPEGINDICQKAVDNGIYVVCYDGD